MNRRKHTENHAACYQSSPHLHQVLRPCFARNVQPRIVKRFPPNRKRLLLRERFLLQPNPPKYNSVDSPSCITGRIVRNGLVSRDSLQGLWDFFRCMGNRDSINRFYQYPCSGEVSVLGDLLCEGVGILFHWGAIVPVFRNILAKSVLGLAMAGLGSAAHGQVPSRTGQVPPRVGQLPPRAGQLPVPPPLPPGGMFNAEPRPTARPAASEALRQKVNSLVEEVLTTEVEMEVSKRRAKILRMKQPMFRTAIADPTIVEVVPFGAREIEFIGRETGSTSVTVWTGTEANPKLLTVLVTVTKDDAVDQMRRLEYSELQDMINEFFPNSRVQLIPIANKVIIRGQARDEEEATQILSIVQANAGGGQGGGLGGGIAQTVADGPVADAFPDASELPASNLINMLEVPGEKQVMLKVRIAELKRSAVRTLGADFNFNVGDFAFNSVLGAGGNVLLTGTFDADSFNLLLRALETNGSAKILAEPNLVVFSGRTANFLSGGEFAVPTVVGVGGAQAATTTFKGFGTQVSFSPTVLDKDRIRLQVTPDVQHDQPQQFGQRHFRLGHPHGGHHGRFAGRPGAGDCRLDPGRSSAATCPACR